MLLHPEMAISGIGFEIAQSTAALIEALDAAPHHPSMGWQCRWGSGAEGGPENER